jgi:hypothetical protein
VFFPLIHRRVSTCETDDSSGDDEVRLIMPLIMIYNVVDVDRDMMMMMALKFFPFLVSSMRLQVQAYLHAHNVCQSTTVD